MKKNEEAITEPASLPALRLSTPQCSAPKAGLESWKGEVIAEPKAAQEENFIKESAAATESLLSPMLKIVIMLSSPTMS